MSAALKRHSVSGRPRRVTETDIAEILKWQRSRETKRQLAARLGLSLTTIGNVIRSQGLHYKTAAPVPQRASRQR